MHTGRLPACPTAEPRYKPQHKQPVWFTTSVLCCAGRYAQCSGLLRCPLAEAFQSPKEPHPKHDTTVQHSRTYSAGKARAAADCCCAAAKDICCCCTHGSREHAVLCVLGHRSSTHATRLLLIPADTSQPKPQALLGSSSTLHLLTAASLASTRKQHTSESEVSGAAAAACRHNCAHAQYSTPGPSTQYDAVRSPGNPAHYIASLQAAAQT